METRIRGAAMRLLFFWWRGRRTPERPKGGVVWDLAIAVEAASSSITSTEPKREKLVVEKTTVG